MSRSKVPAKGSMVLDVEGLSWCRVEDDKWGFDQWQPAVGPAHPGPRVSYLYLSRIKGPVTVLHEVKR